MIEIHPYIHFDGTCKDAMNYYKDIFGGEATIQIVGDSPMKDQMPGGAGSNNKVMHASLMKDGKAILMGADMMDPKTFVKGDNITISVNLDNEEEAKKIFAKLAEGGKVQMELSPQFWGDLFGACTDKFGLDWMVNCTVAKK